MALQETDSTSVIRGEMNAKCCNMTSVMIETVIGEFDLPLLDSLDSIQDPFLVIATQ